MQKIIFRVDASHSIGRGHLERCLMIAKQINQPNKTFFYMNPTQSKYEEMVLENGYALQYLNSDFIKELHFLESCILIVDHYGINIEWEKRVKHVVDRLVVITDFPNEKHNCDVIVDGNPLRLTREYEDQVDDKCVVLAGSKYCFIKKEFIDLKKEISVTSVLENNKIHIYLGSQDEHNLTFYFAKKILENTEYHIVIVVSNAYKYEFSLKNLQSRYGSRVDIFWQPSNMAKTFYGVKYALGAPGLATWERMYLEVPTIFVTTHINQIEILKDIHKQKLGVYLGHYDVIKTENISFRFLKYFNDETLLKEVKEKIKDFIDGKGIQRVVKEVMRSD